MISLAVSRGGRGVGMGSKVMEFCGSIVRALWHDVPPASWMLSIAATALASCSVRTAYSVLCLEYFCGPSRGRSVLHPGFVLRNAASGIPTAGKTMTPLPTALGRVIPCFKRHFVFRSIS